MSPLFRPNDRILLTVAPCIPAHMAGSNPALDLSPEGIAGEVVRAWNAGANIAHLHVWDHKGQPTARSDAFEKTIRLIRQQSDIIIDGSTGGINQLTAEERSVCLGADIEMASLNPGSVNYGKNVFVNSPSEIACWAQEMERRHIKPDIAVFEAGMIANALDLVGNGWIERPLLFTFVLGQQGALPASPKNLLFLSETVPDDSLWCVVGHGGHDLWMSSLAMHMGGHARAGFEDNPYYRPGELAESNAQLIERLVRIAREIGREIASPHEARQMLCLRPHIDASPPA